MRVLLIRNNTIYLISLLNIFFFFLEISQLNFCGFEGPIFQIARNKVVHHKGFSTVIYLYFGLYIITVMLYRVRHIL